MLCRPENLQARQTLEDAQAFLRYLASICHHQDVHFLWRPFLKDPDDDFILELAFAAGARYIVTHVTRQDNHVKSGELDFTIKSGNLEREPMGI